MELPDWGRLASHIAILLYLGVFLGFLATALVASTVLDHAITGSSLEEPIHVLRLLSCAAPVMSISAMGSPLISVFGALKDPSLSSGLQWPLMLAFAISSVLGVCYGHRKYLPSVLWCSAAGLTVQVLCLGGVYLSSRLPNLLARFLIDKLNLAPAVAGSPSVVRDSSSVAAAPWDEKITSSFVKVFVGVGLGLIGIGIVWLFGMTVPVNGVLSPVYTCSCLFPYLATFATFKKDLLDFRQYSTDRGKTLPPPKVDRRTLLFMQANNLLWAMYGILLRDIVITASSLVGYILAAIQIIALCTPIIHLDIEAFLYSHPARYKLTIDPALAFLGKPWKTESTVEMTQATK